MAQLPIPGQTAAPQVAPAANVGQVPATVPQDANQPAPQAPSEPKLTYAEKLVKKIATLEDRILKDKAALTEARLELESLEALGNISEGNHVVIKVGKGEAAKEVVAVVSGVKDEGEGKLLRVLYGSGFDATSAVVKSSAVIRVITPANIEAVEPVAETPAA